MHSLLALALLAMPVVHGQGGIIGPDGAYAVRTGYEMHCVGFPSQHRTLALTGYGVYDFGADTSAKCHVRLAGPK